MSNLGPATIWTAVAIYLFVSLLAITFIPRAISPAREQFTNEERGQALDLQNKIRQTVIQIAAGFGFVFSIFMAVSAQESANRDLKAKYDRESAELLIKATESKTPETLYALTYIARHDKENYHDIVYKMIASLIRNSASSACSNKAGEAQTAAGTKVQVAIQLLHERNVGRYNIEHSCLDGVDLQIERPNWGRHRGLVNVRASGSRLLHVGFTRAELQGAELMGIDAGDWRNPNWRDEKHRYHLHDLDGNGNPKWSALRRKYVAHFDDANLTGARFDGAGLEGADFSGAVLKDVVFSGANISRANFRGAQHLAAEQLMKACVGGDDPDNDRGEQPIINSPGLKQELERRGGVPLC
jgi:uncharacterized protein YjbI with pentapeptide repeats